MALSKVKQQTALLAAGLLMTAVGCGDAGSNNDQGTSVTAVQYCADVNCTTGLTGVVVPLSSSVSAINTGQGDIDGQIIIAFMQVANRLSSQFVRIDRMDCDYEVPGADPSLRIPTDSDAAGAVIEASPGVGVSTANIGFTIVTPDLFAFFNANRASLPELPFRAVASCRAVGVTQSGDTVETNPLTFALQFGDLSECCTGTGVNGGGGFQVGTGTGGDLNTFGDGTGMATAGADEPETGEAVDGEEEEGDTE